MFGEKGAGKTAMRLQIVAPPGRLQRANTRTAACSSSSTTTSIRFSIAFAIAFGSRRRPDRVLARVEAVGPHGRDPVAGRHGPGRSHSRSARSRRHPAGNALTLADLKGLDRHQARDLLLLAACYDQSTAETVEGRWGRLRRKLRFCNWWTRWPVVLGLAVTAAVVALTAYTGQPWLVANVPGSIWSLPPGWLPWLFRFASRLLLACRNCPQRARRRKRVAALRQIFSQFPAADLAGQPLPTKQRTDDRYELLAKFQGILKSLGFSGIVVLVDRVDEPHLINGSVEQMRALLWPMLDNKFLKHPGLGFKLLLPIELSQFIDREDRDFYQRARLDKQNMMPSLEWTGEALYDVANGAAQGVRLPGRSPSLLDLFDESVSEPRLIDALRSLARAAASVQVHVPAVRGPLQRVHRRSSLVEDLERTVRVGAGRVWPRSGCLRPRPQGRLTARDLFSGSP